MKKLVTLPFSFLSFYLFLFLLISFFIPLSCTSSNITYNISPAKRLFFQKDLENFTIQSLNFETTSFILSKGQFTSLLKSCKKNIKDNAINEQMYFAIILRNLTDLPIGFPTFYARYGDNETKDNLTIKAFRRIVDDVESASDLHDNSVNYNFDFILPNDKIMFLVNANFPFSYSNFTISASVKSAKDEKIIDFEYTCIENRSL